MEQNLTNIYKKMFNIENIISNDNTPDIIFNGVLTTFSNMTINSELNFSNDINIFGDLISPSNNNIVYTKNISTTNCNINNITCNIINCFTDLTIINDLNNFNNIEILNNLNVSNMTSNYVNISGLCNVNHINTITILSTLDLLIDSDNINIGNVNSNININGTYLNIMTTDIEISDKVLALNYNSNNSSIDTGNNCGILIQSINNNDGYILSNTENTYFNIKLPDDDIVNYICELELNNDLIITGNSLFHNNVSVNDKLNVSNDSILNNALIDNLYISDSGNLLELNINSFTVVNNFNTINLSSNSITIMNTFYNNNNITILSSVYLNTLICDTLDIKKDIIFSDDVIVYGNITTNAIFNNNNIIVNNNIYSNDITILSNLVFSDNVSILSNLNIDNDMVSLNISSSSNINISNNLTVDGNITIGSNLNTNNIIILPNLKEFENSKIAALNNIPLGGLFRTGNIVRIRDDVTPPTIVLIGEYIEYVLANTIYIESGVSSDENFPVYLVSILHNTTELLNNAILINNNKQIPEINTSVEKTYILTYASKDNNNNIITISRQIKIINAISDYINYVEYTENNIYKNFNLSTDTNDVNYSEYYNTSLSSIVIDNGILSQIASTDYYYNISGWGIKIPVPLQNFDINNNFWSMLLKIKYNTVDTDNVVIDFRLDPSNDGLGNLRDYQALSVIDIKTNSAGNVNNNSTIIYDYGDMLEYAYNGLYLSMYKNTNLNLYEFKIYSNEGVLLKHIRLNNPFIYGNNKAIFLFVYDRITQRTFYSEALFSDNIILTPVAWKIRNTIYPIYIIGNTNINIILNDIYIEQGIGISDNYLNNITVYISSIKDINEVEYIDDNLSFVNNTNISYINTDNINIYIITYIAIDNNTSNILMTLTRNITVSTT